MDGACSTFWNALKYIYWFWYRDQTEEEHLDSVINIVLIISCRNIMGLLELGSCNFGFRKMGGTRSLSQKFLENDSATL